YKYADFSGRARRKEYWMFILFHAIISIALLIVGAILAAAVGRDSPGASGLASGIYGLYSLAVLLPSLAVTVRRLHDTGRGGRRVAPNLMCSSGGSMHTLAAGSRKVFIGSSPRATASISCSSSWRNRMMPRSDSPSRSRSRRAIGPCPTQTE